MKIRKVVETGNSLKEFSGLIICNVFAFLFGLIPFSVCISTNLQIRGLKGNNLSSFVFVFIFALSYPLWRFMLAYYFPYIIFIALNIVITLLSFSHKDIKYQFLL